ncbi:phytoene desaturase family protein [Ilumatobacter coccineus]|uniref:4,4'-diaponeurosporene oxygenase n=1 Tax=Ilumatobacter coccineus (strain NBRC 103263 / KCTC 29153 / YM16-304) TaxID=1313172 RepID=A0A6C7EHM6_ILUCY|nr:phytoene desaturase family protein [Ilumatobacter coccineus]BAN04058.1 putative phytoene dehydrogenase [Ilumatobacter coccineus YM16-304]
MSRRVAIIGGGVGGLATAIRLAVAGHHVTIVEKNERVGGKLSTYERDGFTFDIGPSLLTMPHLFDELFRLAGSSIDDELDLVRLDPQFNYSWRDGSRLYVRDDHDATAAEFDAFSPGAGAKWREFDEHGRTIWDTAERTFFAGPMENPIELAKRMESPSDLLAIDPLRTMQTAARDAFDEPHLRQWVGRYATYSGSLPHRAPATLACIPHIEARYGAWYPMGGLGTLRDALERCAERVGVTIRTGVDVVGVTSAPNRVTGVAVSDGTIIDASIVVANADARHLYADLLPDDAALKQVSKAQRSTSGFAMCIGARGRTEGIGHHNVWFADDAMHEFREIEARQLPSDPTIYGCVSSVTDPSQAPDGDENWFLLVNTPPGIDVDTEAYRNLVLDRLASHGVDLRRRMRFCARIAPADIERMYRSPGGAIYGSSSNGMRAAFARPSNRGAKPGLYLVGGSSHPGGGLPLVATSARIVADMIQSDLA